MSPEAFVAELDRQIAQALARIGSAAKAPPAANLTIADLLLGALKNELEASEEAALWMTRERDVELKLALARQCGDEAKHYRLILERLGELGRDPVTVDPLARGYSPMFEFLRSLETTAERVAAGPFAREALAKVRNEIFAAYCESIGDGKTVRLYREIIQPDEEHHHQLGRRLLLRFAISGQDQARARLAVERTLELAEELQEVARLKSGLSSAPGC